MLTLDPLQPALDRFKADWEARVGADTAGMIAADIASLRASGILDRAAKTGDAWPEVPLLDAFGHGFDLTTLLAGRPAIITFYRGGWCPYCNLELRAWQARLAEVHALGADLVAISPELPDHSLTTVEKNGLAFTVLSDAGDRLAGALGIRFMLSRMLRPFYDLAGHALPDRNGDGSWTLPMPATFVVERGGRIAAAFVEPDYRKRTDPAQALLALRDMTAAKAA
jgi:peroxiredoxin